MPPKYKGLLPNRGGSEKKCVKGVFHGLPHVQNFCDIGIFYNQNDSCSCLKKGK